MRAGATSSRRVIWQRAPIPPRPPIAARPTSNGVKPKSRRTIRCGPRISANRLATSAHGLYPELLFNLRAHVLADQFQEPPLGLLAKLVVVGSLLTDHDSSASIADIEPFAGRSDLSIRAIYTDPGSHLHERSSLGQNCRFLVFDAYQRGTLILLESADPAYEDFISAGCLPDRPPVSGSQHKSDGEYRRDHRHAKDQKCFLHSTKPNP